MGVRKPGYSRREEAMREVVVGALWIGFVVVWIVWGAVERTVLRGFWDHRILE